MNIEDTLAEITTDLVAVQEATPFLKALFTTPAGAWTTLDEYYADLPQLQTSMRQLPHDVSEALQVSWLDYPPSVYGSGYCVIIFFLEALPWHNVVLYNKQWFFSQFQVGLSPVEQAS